MNPPKRKGAQMLTTEYFPLFKCHCTHNWLVTIFLTVMKDEQNLNLVQVEREKLIYRDVFSTQRTQISKRRTVRRACRITHLRDCDLII